MHASPGERTTHSSPYSWARAIRRAAMLALLIGPVSTAACKTTGPDQKAPGAPTPEETSPAAPRKSPLSKVKSAGPGIQGQQPPLSQGIESMDPAPLQLPEDQKDEFFAVPVPFRSQQLGWGLALWGAYLFRPDSRDKDSPPSMLGAGGFYSENESWAAAAALKSYHDHDRWRVVLAGATGEVRYDFFGIGNDAGSAGDSVPFVTTADALYFEVQRAVAPKLFVGPTLSLATTTTDIDVPPAAPPVPDEDQLDTTNLLVGLIAQNDTRDNQFYPRSGRLSTARARFSEESLGSDFTFQRYGFSYNSYHGLGPKSVLAWHALTEYSGGDAPFFALNSFPLRGAEAGRYLDRFMLAGELEYRRELTKRFGVVAFGGVGAVADRPSQLDQSDPLATIGLGLRIRLTERHPIHYRIDVAKGPDSTIFYLSLGEAF